MQRQSWHPAQARERSTLDFSFLLFGVSMVESGDSEVKTKAPPFFVEGTASVYLSLKLVLPLLEVSCSQDRLASRN